MRIVVEATIQKFNPNNEAYKVVISGKDIDEILRAIKKFEESLKQGVK